MPTWRRSSCSTIRTELRRTCLASASSCGKRFTGRRCAGASVLRGRGAGGRGARDRGGVAVFSILFSVIFGLFFTAQKLKIHYFYVGGVGGGDSTTPPSVFFFFFGTLGFCHTAVCLLPAIVFQSHICFWLLAACFVRFLPASGGMGKMVCTRAHL